MRKIHKASVRDRVLYQALYRVLYQKFDKTFIHDVYSSRNQKGIHAGVERFNNFAKKITKNHTQSAFVLKCDIRKFFDSIDHDILLEIVSKYVFDEKLLDLIRNIIDSYHLLPGKGIPLGNVTSQLFANVYMNRFDQYVKHTLKVKYYLRYCDDFIILHTSLTHLNILTSRISNFLQNELSLQLHPRKVEIRKIIHGVDFLGYVSLPHYKVIRTSTKKRMLTQLKRAKSKLDIGKITCEKFKSILDSYLGVLSHCKSQKIRLKVQSIMKCSGG